MPNLKHVVEELRMPGFVPHIYSAQVLVYNPDNVTDPPRTFGDLLDPKWRGKIGMVNGVAPWVVMAASLHETGKTTDFDKGKAFMLKLNANGLRLYPETDSAGAGVQIGRDLGRRDLAGADLHVAERRLPGEGQFPEGRRDPLRLRHGVAEERAEQGRRLQIHQRDAGTSAQQGFAAHMGYLPTVDDAPLSGKVGEQLAFPDPKPKLVTADYPVFARRCRT